MNYQKKIQAMEQEMKEPILKKIRSVVEDVSKKEDVDFTFESSAAPIIYAKKSKDLTNAVIKAFNAN